MDQLWGILEIGSSSKGHANMDQSQVTDTILTAMASGYPSRNILMMKDLVELLGIKYTGAWQVCMK
jgi:hypothetical protein